MFLDTLSVRYSGYRYLGDGGNSKDNIAAIYILAICC